MHATGLLRVGPVSKLYVAGVVLQLADEGRLSLDDRLSRFIPDWPNGDAITIRMLLSGTSGVASFGEPLEALERRVAADPDRSWTARDALVIARTAPPRFDPGTRVSPTDTDDALLAMVIEDVTGTNASAEIRRRFLDPLGLRETYAAGEAVPPPGSSGSAGQMFRGHRIGATPGVLETVDDLDADVLAVLGPARGMAAMVGDVARWSDLLHHRPGLLSDASRALLGLPYERGGAGGAEACPCNGGSTRALVIGGPVAAYSALVAWFPERQATIAILTDRVVAAADMQTLLERLDALVPSSPSR
jgi:CubicO group peptidase (beta-lactamase class C family)